MNRLVLAGLGITCLLGPASRAEDVKIVAVASLHVATGRASDSAFGELAAELLAIALADRTRLVVVDRQRLDDVLREQNLTLEGLVTPATAARVGQLLRAHLVVSGSLLEAKGKLRFAVNLVAVEGQQVLAGVQVDGDRKQIDAAVWKLASQVAKAAGSPLPDFDVEQLDDSPEGRLHLMRGIGLYYANQPDRAIVSLLRAVRLDPRLQESRLWIARSYLRRNETENARTELQRLAQNPAAKLLARQIQQLLKQCQTPN